MYLQFFGLRENPFSVTADPSFLYLTPHHREALTSLVYGIKERKGFIEITGEIGTGKTTLCRALLRELDSSVRTAFVINPDLPELQILQSILQDFGLTPRQRSSKLALLQQLNSFMLEQLMIGNNTVVIIDEAQNLSHRLLESLRMLSNLETDKEKLLQLVLVGQPQLREKLKAPELAQLRQRIAVRFHIPPLAKTELRPYLEHRLQVAGSDGSLTITDGALEEIFRYSGGTPRPINILCDKALLACYAQQARVMTDEIVRRSIEELEGKVTVR